MADDPELAALLEEFSVDEEDLLPTTPGASEASISYARDLLRQCDMDEDDYDFDTMSQKEVSELIDELRDMTDYRRHGR